MFDKGLGCMLCREKRGWRNLNFALISLKKGQTESLTFLELIFFCERDGQHNFKFDIHSAVLFIYPLIPRKPDFLG
jgi:hypothetical protein